VIVQVTLSPLTHKTFRYGIDGTKKQDNPQHSIPRDGHKLLRFEVKTEVTDENRPYHIEQKPKKTIFELDLKQKLFMK
jgi:hypothetical protein